MRKSNRLVLVLTWFSVLGSRFSVLGLVLGLVLENVLGLALGLVLGLVLRTFSVLGMF